MEEVDPRSLEAHEGNWRLHPEKQLEILERLLGDLGQIGAIVASQRTRRVLNGHARLRIAIEREVPSVLVQWVDLSPDEEDSVLATFDAVAGMRTTREDRWARLLRRDEVKRATAGIVLRGERQEIPERRMMTVDMAERPTVVRRNRSWYVYIPRSQYDEVAKWLEERLGGVEDVTLGSA